MQADLAQSQQQKQQISSANDGALQSGTAPTESQDSNKYVAGLANRTSSQAMNASDTVVTAAASIPSQPSLSSVGFTPFAKHPAKQKRYEAYLAAQKAGTPCKSVLKPHLMYLFIVIHYVLAVK